MPQRVHRRHTGRVVTLFPGGKPPRGRGAGLRSPRSGWRTFGGVDECACGTTATRPGMAALGQTDPAVLEREIQRLAELYDAARPPVSFSRWAADRGAGALVDEFKAMLRAAGALDVAAALDATPAPPERSPEEKIAAFDAPIGGGGPWALDAAGNWFAVTTQAPGSQVLDVDGRAIYVPAVHPSVHASTRPCMDDAGERFSEQKMRAANAAVLKGDWRTLYTRVAPRGAPGQAIGAPQMFDGSPDDYEAEGGELYPGLTPSDGQARVLWQWWDRQPWCDPHGGTPPISWLRVYTDAEGYQRYKGLTLPEIQEFHRWRLATGGYACTQGENSKNAGNDYNLQLARRSGLSDGEYTPYWVTLNVHPLGLCSPTSSSRRRKALKKAAAIAAVVVGAVFLGPTIAGALKGAGGVAKIGALTSKVIPKVVQAANAVTTIKAVKDGKVPPPPISLDGTRFVDYASAIGTNLVERELQEQGQKLEASQRALLEAQMQQQVRALQQSAAAQLPLDARYGAPISSVSPDLRAAMSAPPPDWIKYAAVGGAALLLLTMLR